MSNEVQVACPHCGSEEIVGYDKIVASASISGWKRAADGSLAPEWEGSTEVHYDAQEPYNPDKPYMCTDCQNLWAASELKVQ